MSPSPTPPSENDIRPIVPPENYFTNHIGLWISVAIGLLLVSFLIWKIWKTYQIRKNNKALTPQEKAYKEFEKLEEKIQELDPRQFGKQVCDILRIYLVQEYGLQADRQTSTEFISYIHNTHIFSEKRQKLLTEFLEHCDLLKFARHDASLGAKKEFIDCGREFILKRNEEHGVDAYRKDWIAKLDKLGLI